MFHVWVLSFPARWVIVQHGSELPLLATDKEQANKALRKTQTTSATQISWLLVSCFNSIFKWVQKKSAVHLLGRWVGVHTFAILLLFHYWSRSQQGLGSIMSLSVGQLPTDIITLLCELHWEGILINCLSKASVCVTDSTWHCLLQQKQRRHLMEGQRCSNKHVAGHKQKHGLRLEELVLAHKQDSTQTDSVQLRGHFHTQILSKGYSWGGGDGGLFLVTEVTHQINTFLLCEVALRDKLTYATHAGSEGLWRSEAAHNWTVSFEEWVNVSLQWALLFRSNTLCH